MSVPSTTLSPNPWARILDALEKKINRHSYDTWLKPTRYSHSSGGILFVRVPTVEFRHAGDKYADLIQEAIDKLIAGRSSIIIAHRLSTIRKASQIIVLDKGEIREIGTHDQLLAKGGFYAKLHEMQFSKQVSGERKAS